MKTDIGHLPQTKQRELERVVRIIHEEFAGIVERSKSEAKKDGRIYKIILFGSYARGTWVDEPHTSKGYRSDFDILVIVSNKELADPKYWDKATDRLMWDKEIETPVGLIMHGAREISNFLHDGQAFFVDIAREGIVLYEFDDRPLAEPKPLRPADALRVAREHFALHNQEIGDLLASVGFFLERGNPRRAAFELHQAVETAYNCYLLTVTNYSPASHNLKFLRGLSEDRDRRLVDIWPRDHQRFTAWYNILNEAYVKARYSKRFEISEEALAWLQDRTAELHALIEALCREHINKLQQVAKS
ncbi:nucleotidyltransferase and HEPN domain-containing protein [Agrobacterium tumefaciens]|uniref:HEPN domain-containing protein n=1 Tax=Agrobacterium tumefaciens TaxID=358 RepID=A0AA44F4N5_AGRTU|nr:nucleotidyltransferase and HEPN domain-containing protein [Agrobacterium tumefaciens]NSL21194.1 HEPN domain-containing protein [Agrobacterium tumefaciens]NTB83766.1 HEPN domain-containing protein [Agrobacterium tumefaciens]NTC20765.1 HEPN domain-containing protein [Agrobacterium tumefaciens]NTC29237.1 HEPN domain-containing protein [Agrobacterium tumefaciens]NTC57517.1 HEPN domain-containing protein [Agrobacterium tumefaciens]